jgi:tetratricopeptide (TPR) repeat protein
MSRFVVTLFLIFIIKLSVGSPQELFSEANSAYERSEYGYAIELYSQILEEGFVSADLYYNLGNAYFKDNMMGPAILYYERALRINPLDEDLNHNIAVAKSKIVDKPEQRPKLFYEKWWVGLRSIFTMDGWAIVSIVLLILFLALVSLYLFSKTIGVKKSAFYGLLVILGFFILSVVFAKQQYNIYSSDSEAIIMETRVTAKSSPSVESSDLFLLHEGTKVKIRSQLSGFYEISLPNGTVGWIKKETLEII